MRKRFSSIKRRFFGTTTIRTDPAGVEVLVDGRPWGKTPLVRVAVPPGAHRLELRMGDRTVRSRGWLVSPGQEDRLIVSLKPGENPRSAATFTVLRRGKVCSRDGWCWENPLPQGNNLHGVWGSGPGDVFVVGRKGTIMHYNGRKWRRMSTPETAALYGVWGSSKRDVFAVGARGTIIHYDGRKWTTMASPEKKNWLRSVWGSGPKDVYAVGTSGTILHYDGQTWRAMESGTDIRLNTVSGSGPENVFVVGDKGTILHLGAL